MDYRRLNADSHPQHHPLPLIDDLVDQLTEAQFFSTVDLKYGYYKMPMRREYAAKTAFATPDGQYKWAGQGTPFSLSGAKVTFQRLMSAILGELNCTAALCYLDHVLVWGHRKLDGAQQPVAGGAQETQVGWCTAEPRQMLFRRLRQNRFTLSEDLCSFLFVLPLTADWANGYTSVDQNVLDYVTNNLIQVDLSISHITRSRVSANVSMSNISSISKWCVNYTRTHLAGVSSLGATKTICTNNITGTLDITSIDTKATYSLFAYGLGPGDSIKYCKSPSTTILPSEPPQIVNLPVQLRVNQYSSATVTCDASGAPAPTLTWLYNGAILSTSAALTITEETFTNDNITQRGSQGKRSVLLLHNVTYVNNKGPYTCLAANFRAPDATSSADLKIFVPPSEVRPPLDVSSSETATARFDCNMYAIPAARITWYKDGKLLYASGDIQLSTDNATLLISNLEYSDRGQYHCMAENRDAVNFTLGGMVQGSAATLLVYVPSEPPQIVNLPVQLRVNQYSSATVTCDASGAPAPTLTWLYNGAILSTSAALTITEETFTNDNITQRGSQGKRSVLLLHNVTYVNNKGPYTCLAANFRAPDATSSADLKIFVPPSEVRPPLDVSSSETATARFDCNMYAIPAARITWYKDGKLLYASGDIQLSTDNATLLISNLEYSDRGQYHCMAENRDAVNFTLGGMVQGSAATLLVYVQPRITTGPSDKVLNEGTSSALRCTSYGYPKPVMQWLHGGVQLPAMRSTTAITKAGNGTVPASYTSTLTVSNIVYADRGQYTCVSRVDKTGFADSSHLQGSVTASATVKVYIPPSEVRPPLDVRSSETATARFDCNMYAVPAARITWYKDAKLLHPSGDIQFSTDNSTLLISNLEYSDRGQYHCMAENRDGVNFTLGSMVQGSAATLLVYVQPRITSEPSDKVLNEGTSSALRCTSYGYPMPVIQWLHGGVQLPAMRSTTAITTAGNDTVPASHTSTLTVSNIMYGDRGQYTCVSRVDKTGFADTSQLQGSVSASATVKVYIPPMVLTPTLNQAVLAGQTVEFTCNVYGIPKPRVTWFANGLILQKDDLVGRISFHKGDHILTIYTTKVTDPDTYQCEASNKDQYAGGVVTANQVKLNVKIAPVINPPIPKTLLSFEGSSLTVPCTYTGHPQPKPSWCRLDNNGNCVKSVPSSNCPDFTPMDDGQFTYILVISNLQSCHSGGYQCSVNNTVDKATGQFQLTVQGVARIGLQGIFTLPSGYLGGTEDEIKGLFKPQIVDYIIPGRLVKIVHSSYQAVGQSSTEITVRCDMTAPAGYIAEISGNSSEANLNANFTSALQNSASTLRLARASSLKVFSYDVCSPEVTDGARRGMFYWTETFANELETHLCPVELTDGIIRYATRRCIPTSRPHDVSLVMATWQKPDIADCPTPGTAKLQKLSKVDFNTSEPQSVLSSSLSVANLTNNSAELTSDDIDFASTAIFNLVTAVSKDEVFNQSIGQKIAVSILDTVDNILQVNTNETVVAASPAKRIAKAMERLVTSLVVETDQPFQEQKENIGFAISCPKENATDQAFRSAGQTKDGRFYVGDVDVPASASTTGVSFDIAGSTVAAATELLSLGNDSLCNVAPTRYILYKTQTLFRDSNLSANTSVQSEIISAQVGEERLENLQQPAIMSFDLLGLTPVDSAGEAICVFWDFDKDDGNGGWSDWNCTTFRDETTGNRTVCQCGHLTNFAVLFTRHISAKDSTAEAALKYISIIGCGISMLGLLTTLVLILAIRKLRDSVHHRMIFGLCSTLLLFLAIFTVVLYHEHLAKSTAVCQGLAMAMHYLLLCAFMWMSVDATMLYKRVVIVFDQPGRLKQRLLCISVFVIPLVIVGVAGGVTRLDMYGSDNLCWIKADAAFFGSLVAPMAVSLLYNAGVLIAVVHSLRSRNKKIGAVKTAKSKDVSVLRIIVSLSVLLGLTWFFGFLVLFREQIVFQYIFTVLNSLQGFAIFLHTIRGQEAKKHISEMFSSTKRATDTQSGKPASRPKHVASENLDNLEKSYREPRYNAFNTGPNYRRGECSGHPGSSDV
ncbi:uncharacterized protein LOC135829246 [Sycon ciliatum]|uniref:uncharacterized protein LOC135829246 n=1 Tax=Sycon ciliatum TaxID=27933 RepID=UPI0031F6383C